MLAVLALACGWTASDTDAARWYSESALAASVSGSSVVITATTPLPVMCALVWRRQGDDWGTVALQPMMMTGASTAHSIVLPQQTTGIELVAFSWLPFGRAIFRSANYQLGPGSTALTIEAGSTAIVVLPPSGSGGAPLRASSVTSSSATVGVHSNLCSAVASAYASATDAAALSATSNSSAHELWRMDVLSMSPQVVLTGMASSTAQTVGGAFVAADLTVTYSQLTTFTTLASSGGSGGGSGSGGGGSSGSGSGGGSGGGSGCVKTNLALTSAGATVVSTSSSFGGSWAGASAIDGVAGTAWSSAGDGNGASITVALASSTLVGSVGYHSRSMMDGTAITSAYDVYADGTKVASCSVPDTASVHECALPSQTTATSWRFVVTGSTGGNVGAHAIEIYAPCPSSGRRRLSMHNGGMMAPSPPPACVPSTNRASSEEGDQTTVVAAAVGGGVGALVLALAVGLHLRTRVTGNTHFGGRAAGATAA